MRAHRWGLLLAVALATATASCSTAEQTVAGAPPSSSVPETSASTAGTRPPTSPVATSTFTSTTSVDATPTARPIQLAPEPGTCTLVPGRTDFADFPTDRVEPAIGSMPGSLPDIPDTFPGEAGFATPVDAYLVGGSAPWFQVSDVGLARFDADAVAVEDVLVTTPSCRIHQLAGDGDLVAVRACAESIYAQDPGACTLVVADRSGAIVARWALEGTTGPGTLTWADGQVVFVSVSGPPLLAYVLDPRTGAGSVVDSMAGCAGTANASQLVASTTLVNAHCAGAPTRGLIDARTGVVVSGVAARDDDIVIVDSPVRRPTDVLVDPATGAVVPTTPMHPTVMAAIDADPNGQVTRVTESPQGAWVERCLAQCGQYSRSVMELSFVDLGGQVVARWPVTSAAPSRGGSPPASARAPIVDATGAWVPVDGRVVRLRPIA